MAESIYHLNEQGRIEPMSEEPFALEDTLQELVANHPELLSGEQMAPENPRRWILVKREQGIADTEGGSNRWAVDHLLIDQDSIPTLVEVKRSANSQVRREVVGQMLDYAAHARHTWNPGDIRRDFEASAEAAGHDPDTVLAELLQSEDEPDAEEFWQRVGTNLRAARLRLLFVADGIPDELTRVVEFLNEQMPNIEVLAVEIKQFRGETGRTLVPRVIGRTTAAAPPTRASAARSRMALDEFLDQMPGQQVREAAQRLMNVAQDNGAFVQSGSSGISIRCRCPAWPDPPFSLAWIYPGPGRIGWNRTRDFTFGMTTWGMDIKPPALVEVLESWTAQFEDDAFTSNASSKEVTGWTISHEDAAANIDVLAERLENVLRSLQQLEVA